MIIYIKEGNFNFMKKKIIIVLLVLLILTISIYIVINLINRNKNEALELFNEYAFFYIDLKRDINNIDEIKQKVMKLKYVKSVDVNSNENKLNEHNDRLNKYNIDIKYYNDVTIFNNSFYVKFEFKSEDLDNIKEIQNSLMNEIMNIKEVEKIENSRFNHFINVYKDKGINGLKLICKFYEEIDNMDSKEILKYYEDNQEFVDEYSKYLY